MSARALTKRSPGNSRLLRVLAASNELARSLPAQAGCLKSLNSSLGLFPNSCSERRRREGDKEAMPQLEEALHRLAWNGRYHITLFVILAAITIRDPWPIYGIVFMGQGIAHHCRLPENDTLSHTSSMLCDGQCSCDLDRCRLAVNGSDNATVPCPDGWQYATPFVSKFHYALDYETSIVMEWDLVCDRSYMVDLSTTILMAGVMVGSLLSQLSDKLGRKHVLLFSLWIQGAIGTATALVTDFTQFSIARFAVGAINQVTMLVGFVYLIELYPASSRTKPGMFVQIFWGVGLALLAPIAYLFKNWRLLQLTIGLTSALFIPVYWILPESVYWLVSMGRTAEAEAVLRKAAKMNGISLSATYLSNSGGGSVTTGDEEKRELQGFLPSVEETTDACEPLGDDDQCLRSPESTAADSQQVTPPSMPKRHTIRDLFASPALRRYTFVLFCIWFVDSLNYVSFSLSMSELYGNKYVNFFIGGLIEIPAYVIAALLANRFGRRFPLLALSTLSGACSIVLFALPTSLTGDCEDKRMDIVRTCMAMIGKFGLTGSYAILTLLCPEIYPTSIRSLGLGLCFVCDNLGGMCAPLVNVVNQYVPGLPRVLLGILAIATGLAVLFLPETHGRPLPEDVKDVEAWGKSQETLGSTACRCRGSKS